MGSTKGAEAEEEPERETWTRKIDFLLACIGFSVGLGNVWRFPYLCYKNGGGAFLVPYAIMVAIGGIPLFFLEVAVGQFMSQGGINAWNLVPFFKGIGFATTIIVFFLNCYYNVILCWAFYYMFASFTTSLPWDKNKVLAISSGIHEMGTLKWDLAVTLFLAWCVVYFCIFKGIKSSGKVMYFTATSPYIFMTILLIRAALLPGARDGLIYYLVPDFNRLADTQVWIDAGTQIFFSYSISLGALTALGSYNKFHHNSYRDSIIFAMTNSGTSIFAGFVIFMVLGFMAKEQGVTVAQVAESGPGLAFIAYPKAVSQMPAAPIWSVLFFFMVILLGLDSQFVGVEGLVTALMDVFATLRRKRNKSIFIGCACFVQFLVGLAMVTNGGMYVFQLFDYYSGSRIILFVAFFECIGISYIYGINRFYDNLEMMFGFRINPYMKITVFIMSTITYSELTYSRPTGTYQYPSWAVGIGWGLAATSAVFIPLVALFKTLQFVGRGDALGVFRPEGLKDHQLRPQDRPQQGPVITGPGVGGADNPSYVKELSSF